MGIAHQASVSVGGADAAGFIRIHPAVAQPQVMSELMNQRPPLQIAASEVTPRGDANSTQTDHCVVARPGVEIRRRLTSHFAFSRRSVEQDEGAGTVRRDSPVPRDDDATLIVNDDSARLSRATSTGELYDVAFQEPIACGINRECRARIKPVDAAACNRPL